MNKFNAGLMLIIIDCILVALRLGVYGFDFGLISVWSGSTEFSWARLGLDFLCGWFAGFGAFLVMFHVFYRRAIRNAMHDELPALMERLRQARQ